MKKFLIVLLAVSALGQIARADENWDCTTESEGTTASLESAGVNPTCPDSGSPWACYCKYVDTCRETNSGHTRKTHYTRFNSCGDLGTCNFGVSCN